MTLTLMTVMTLTLMTLTLTPEPLLCSRVTHHEQLVTAALLGSAGFTWTKGGPASERQELLCATVTLLLPGHHRAAAGPAL